MTQSDHERSPMGALNILVAQAVPEQPPSLTEGLASLVEALDLCAADPSDSDAAWIATKKAFQASASILNSAESDVDANFQAMFLVEHETLEAWKHFLKPPLEQPKQADAWWAMTAKGLHAEATEILTHLPQEIAEPVVESILALATEALAACMMLCNVRNRSIEDLAE